MSVRPAMKCEEGFLTLDFLPLDATIVQVEAAVDSVWRCCIDYYCGPPLLSPHVAVPEFDFFFGLLAGVMLIGAIYERAWERREQRALRYVWFKGQRGTVRRWIRKVLHQ